jgi:hypothetical protein
MGHKFAVFVEQFDGIIISSDLIRFDSGLGVTIWWNVQ